MKSNVNLEFYPKDVYNVEILGGKDDFDIIVSFASNSSIISVTLSKETSHYIMNKLLKELPQTNLTINDLIGKLA